MSTGGAVASYWLDEASPFVGRQCQSLAYIEGNGHVGVYNQGLNQWGLHLETGKPYEGVVFARASEPCQFWVALENHDGSVVLDETDVMLEAGDWTRCEFSLTPAETVEDGRFTLN